MKLYNDKASDFIAALEAQQPKGAVPIWELHFHCWQDVAKKRYVGRPEFDTLSPVEQEKAVENNAEVMVEVAEVLHFGGVTIPDPPWDCYFTLPMEHRFRLAKKLRSGAEGNFLVVAACPGIIGMPGAGNYVEFSYKLFDAPDEIDEIAKKALGNGIETAKKLRDFGVQAVYAAADVADNRGPWYSPEQMDRYIYPYLKKWTEQIRAMGMYAILHTDGEVTPMLDELVESGLHAIQAIDPVAGMDIKSTKEKVQGRLCLCGNVDCGELIVGSPEGIYNSTRKLLLDNKAGGGLVLGASNAVVIETPLENYMAVIKAWEDVGSYNETEENK